MVHCSVMLGILQVQNNGVTEQSLRIVTSQTELLSKKILIYLLYSSTQVDYLLKISFELTFRVNIFIRNFSNLLFL